MGAVLVEESVLNHQSKVPIAGNSQKYCKIFLISDSILNYRFSLFRPSLKIAHSYFNAALIEISDCLLVKNLFDHECCIMLTHCLQRIHIFLLWLISYQHLISNLVFLKIILNCHFSHHVFVGKLLLCNLSSLLE